MSSHEHQSTNVADEISFKPLFAREGEETIPWRMPDREMLPNSAYQVIHDELMLTARVVIGTFMICRLRERGWQVPACPMPADSEDMTVMRVVLRNGVSMDLIRLLIDDIHASVTFLDGSSAPIPRPEGPATPFHH